MSLPNIPIAETNDDLRNKYEFLIKEAQNSPKAHSSMEDIETLIFNPQASAEQCTYIQAGGGFGTYKFWNTCVIDSILAQIHILAILYPGIRELFKNDQTIHAVLCFLDCREYNKAKALWLINLCLQGQDFLQRKTGDIRGYISDHLPNFKDLVCATFNYDEESAAFNFDEESGSTQYDNRITNTTLRAFEAYGDVKLLGTPLDPKLVLVNIDGRMDTFPRPSITDDYDRKYALQSLLLGRITADFNHMVLCTKLIDRWMIYDGSETQVFQEVDFSQVAECFVPYSAAYVRERPKQE